MEGNKHLFDCSHNFFPPEQETLQNSSETSHPTFEDFTYTSAVFSVGKRQEWQFLYELSLCKDGIPRRCIAPMHTLSFSALSFSFRQCLFISWWWERNWWCLWHIVLLQLVLIGSIYHLYITLEVQRLFLDLFPQSSVLVGVHNQRVYLLKVVFDLPGYYLRMKGYISPPWTPRPDIELVKQLLSKPKVGFAQRKVVGRTGK